MGKDKWILNHATTHGNVIKKEVRSQQIWYAFFKKSTIKFCKKPEELLLEVSD